MTSLEPYQLELVYSAVFWFFLLSAAAWLMVDLCMTYGREREARKDINRLNDALDGALEELRG